MDSHGDERTWAERNPPRLEMVDVPAHQTPRLTVRSSTELGMGAYGGADWVFSFARTGCLRVQRGDFCGYIPVEALQDIRNFIKDYGE